MEKNFTAYLILIVFSALTLTLSCAPPAAQKVPIDHMKIIQEDAKVLIVVHSRSGNTAEAGGTLAFLTDGDYYRLEVPAGAGDSYFDFPDRKEIVKFKPTSIDFTPYDTIFIGSPIWWDHPTAHICSFIKAHDFSGKRVILFYTYEGSTTIEALQEWENLIKTQGGKFIDIFGVDIDELEGETLAQRIETITGEKKEIWDLTVRTVPNQ